MRAVIMCGGIGSRLRPLTESVPKPLIKLLNVPVLKQIIMKLINSGIKDIYLSLGYMAADIISYCESQNFNASLHYFTEDKPLGTAGGVKNCIKSSNEPVLVLSGDNIFGFDLREIEKYHSASGASCTLIGKYCDDPREYGTVLAEADGSITGFSEKPTWENAKSFLINTGTYLINDDILKMIPDKTEYDFSNDLFPRLIGSGKIFKCYKTDELWGDIGEFDSYLSLTSELLKDKCAEVLCSGRLYTKDETDENGNTIIAPCLIDRLFLMGKNCTIGPNTVIGSGVTIGSNCTISGSVLGADCTVADSTDITGAVIDDGVVISDNCCIESGSVLGYGVKVGRFARTLGSVKVWPGKTVGSESTVSGDIVFTPPQKTEFDIFGISGNVFSQFTVSDAAKIGQALASTSSIKRIGVGCDGTPCSELYSSLLLSGARSCGAVCYDFEKMFKAQCYFYSAYCSLDAFVYISSSSDVVNFSFFGKNGLPFSQKSARKVSSNYRFSVFSYAHSDEITDCFKMNLLSTVYSALLNKAFTKGEYFPSLGCECENDTVKRTFDSFIKRNLDSEKNPSTRIQFLFNETGTDMYCLENEHFYSSDRIRAAIAETVFTEGKSILVKEDAPDCIFEKAKEYGCTVTEVFENSDEEIEVSGISLIDNLWNFDALFLGAKLAGILSVTGLTLEELCRLQKDFAVRKSVMNANCTPGEVRAKILSTGAEKTARNDVYYTVDGKKGTVRMRQLGNSDRIRLLVEAADMETAKELTAEFERKFELRDIDNTTK